MTKRRFVGLAFFGATMFTLMFIASWEASGDGWMGWMGAVWGTLGYFGVIAALFGAGFIGVTTLGGIAYGVAALHGWLSTRAISRIDKSATSEESACQSKSKEKGQMAKRHRVIALFVLFALAGSLCWVPYRSVLNIPYKTHHSQGGFYSWAWKEPADHPYEPYAHTASWSIDYGRLGLEWLGIAVIGGIGLVLAGRQSPTSGPTAPPSP
jgi:hypothetical protein